MDALGLDAEDIERRLADLSDSEGQSGASRYTELYFGPAGSGERPLVILHHIRKTAGTSLRAVMKSNYPEAQCVQVAHLGYSKQMAESGYSKKAYLSRSRLLELHRMLWERLTPHERRSLCCVASHEANFLQPFVDRQTIIVSLIRDPVERVLSAYYFKRRSTSRSKADRTLEEIYQLVSKRDPMTVVNKLYLFNGQSRSILEPFYDTRSMHLTAGPSGDADLWRERLFSLVDEAYLLGISERFDEFVARLAATLGWQETLLPRMKVNTERPQRDALSPDLLHTIAGYNWLDQELYERQLARLGSALRYT